jgi:hypothetical protein
VEYQSFDTLRLAGRVVVAGNTVSIAVSSSGEEDSVVEAAVSIFRRFYPFVEIERDGPTIRMSADHLAERQLRTAWLSHLLEAKTHAASACVRTELLERLFL